MTEEEKKRVEKIRVLAEDARNGYAAVTSHKYGQDVLFLLELLDRKQKEA